MDCHLDFNGVAILVAVDVDRQGSFSLRKHLVDSIYFKGDVPVPADLGGLERADELKVSQSVDCD